MICYFKYLSIFFSSRINEYVKNGQEKILIDPSPNKLYSRGKELQSESKDSSRVSYSTTTFIKGTCLL